MKLLCSLLVGSACSALLLFAGGCDRTPADPASQETGNGVDAGGGSTPEEAAAAMPISPDPAQTQSPPVQPEQPEVRATQADEQDEDTGGVPDPDEEAKRLQAAERLLQGMVRAYRSAPALVDRVKAQQWFGDSPGPEEELIVRLGPDKDAELDSKHTHLVAADGFFYATRAESGRYLKVPLQEDLLETAREVLGAQPGVSVQLRFRYGKSPEMLLHALTLGSLEGVRISSYRRVTDNAGQELEQLTLLSATGSAVVNVDPETKLIKTLEVDFVPPDAPVANLHIRQHLEFNPEVHEELPTPISFDTEGLREVRTWKQVLGSEPLDSALVVEEGQEVPDFTLYTLEGRKVVLSELKGQPVLLYFWSVSNVASRKNLQQLGAYHQWLRSSSEPVEFYPVNTLSRLPVEGRWEEAFKTWESTAVPAECLIDIENEVADAWGITAANVLVVVDAEGRLSEVVFGPSDDTVVETLREQTKKATAEAADNAEGG